MPKCHSINIHSIIKKASNEWRLSKYNLVNEKLEVETSSEEDIATEFGV